MAWTGTYPEGRPDKITVEAPALDGRPVFFRILGPWTEPEFEKTSSARRLKHISLEVLLRSVVRRTWAADALSVSCSCRRF
jgi:hypothetical protein